MSEFDSWAVLELFGHRKLAGRVRDVELFGARMCRIDVPSEPPVTQYYAPSAVFGVHPSTEALCTLFARRAGPPSVVQPWEVGAPALPASTRTDDDSECAECGNDLVDGRCEECDEAEAEAEEDGRVSPFDGIAEPVEPDPAPTVEASEREWPCSRCGAPYDLVRCNACGNTEIPF